MTSVKFGSIVILLTFYFRFHLTTTISQWAFADNGQWILHLVTSLVVLKAKVKNVKMLLQTCSY